MEEGKQAEIVQETRLFDENKQITFPMRSKEGLADYRYFPEPDLPAVSISEEDLKRTKVPPQQLYNHRRVEIMPSPFRTF